jgi:hypothetical protein
VLERRNWIKKRQSSQIARKLDKKLGQTISIRKDSLINQFQQLSPQHLLQHHLHLKIALNLLDSKHHVQLSFAGNHLVAHVWFQLDSWHNYLKSLKRSLFCLNFSKCVVMALNQQNVNFSKPRIKITKMIEVNFWVLLITYIMHSSYKLP